MKSEIMNILKRGIDKEDAISITKFPIKALSLSKKSIHEALLNIRQNRKSKTVGPVEVMYNIETGQFIVTDGYHRVVDCISKKKNLISVKIWSTIYSDYYANVSSDDLFFKPIDILSFPSLDESLLSEVKVVAVVVGIITPQGEILSKIDDSEQRSHSSAGFHYGTKWRYNPKTKIVYWPSSNWSEQSDDDKVSVENHLHKKYNFDVKDHIDMNFKGGHKYVRVAHGDMDETYRKNYQSDEKDKNADEYFKIGQEDEENTAKSFCWIWSRADQGLRVKQGKTHGSNFGHEIAGNTFKGWYDPSKKAISFVFPDHELRKFGNRKPTVDDIPTNIYNKLVSQFGKDNRIIVFESKIKSELKQIFREIIQMPLNESVYDWVGEDDDDDYGGWIDPAGKFHPVRYQQHNAYAAAILKQLGIDRNLQENAYEEMYKLKFIRVVFFNGMLHFNYTMTQRNQKLPAPGPKQMKELKDLAIEHRCMYLFDDNINRIVTDLLQESFDFEKGKYDDVDWKGWWLEPNGTFHDVRSGTGIENTGHWNWAKYYIQRTQNRKLSEHDSPTSILFDAGWIRITFNYYRDGELHFDTPKQTSVTTSLLKKLKDLAIELHASGLINDNTNKVIDISEVKTLNEVRQMFQPDGEKRWWMDTKGDIYDASKEGHSKWGMKYIIKTVGSKHQASIYAQSSFQAPYEILFGLGWVRLLYVSEQRLLVYEFGDIKPTSTQMSRIKKLGNDLNARAIYNEVTGATESLDENLSEEMSYDDLLKLTTPERKERASNVNVRSLPVSVENGLEQWNFRYKSSPQTTVTDKPFRGSISFIKGKVGQNNNAMKMKCKVDCECPDFMYRFAYNDAAKGASQIGTDSLNGALNRKPKPAYDYGEGLCKHLTALGRFLKTKIQATKKSNLFEALDDVAKQGPFNVTYYD